MPLDLKLKSGFDGIKLKQRTVDGFITLKGRAPQMASESSIQTIILMIVGTVLIILLFVFLIRKASFCQE